MKKNYKVRITETLVMTVDIEAHSRDEAEVFQKSQPPVRQDLLL